MDVFSFSKDDLEEAYDNVKVAVLSALANDKLISLNDAEIWCEKHTIILKRKSFFRTISDKWRKTEPDSTKLSIFVVKDSL